MAGKLLAEIKQTKPFKRPEEEAYLNLIRTADEVRRRVEMTLRPHGISEAQYNVLRILRGAGLDGLPCGEIGDRMVTHDPDVTRLLDKLESNDLIVRQRGSEDRRVVVTRITEKGLELLKSLDAPLEGVLNTSLGLLGPARLRTLIELLEIAREQ